MSAPFYSSSEAAAKAAGAKPSIIYVAPDNKKSRAVSEIDDAEDDGNGPRKRSTMASSASCGDGWGGSCSKPKQPVAFELSSVPGLDLVDPLDVSSIKKLIVFVVLIKCPDQEYNSSSYEKPKWWRVEDGVTFYNIVIGGWKTSVKTAEIDLIRAWDTNVGDRRNIIQVEVGNRPTNDDGRVKELSIIITYKKQASLMRDLAAMDPKHRSVAEAADAAAAESRSLSSPSSSSSVMKSMLWPLTAAAKFTLYGPGQ